jgi:hypothetical protein
MNGRNMNKAVLKTAAVIGGLLVVGCSESPVAVERPTVGEPNAAVKTGEAFEFIKIDNSSSLSLAVGGTAKMAGTLHYSLGGTLPSSPYASWTSTDNCVATVSSAYPSWGTVKGVKSGTAKIIASAWGKADTVTVTVTGTGNLDAKCAENEWSWNYRDVSFTGSPAKSYGVKAGEKLKQVVLFAGPSPDYTIAPGASVTLRSELWYNKGGKLNGRKYVSFSTTDGSVATVSNRGVVHGIAPGRVKVIARLGEFADTVPLYVK